DFTVYGVEAFVALSCPCGTCLVIFCLERLLPFLPESMFERGTNGTTNEFPRVVVAIEKVLPELLIRIKIDIRQFLFALGLAQHRLSFGSRDSNTCIWFRLIFFGKKSFFEVFSNEPLSDRPAARAVDDGLGVRLALDRSDTIVNQQVANF